MKRLVVFSLCGALAGCATYRVQVKAERATAEPTPVRTYFMPPATAASPTHSPQFAPALRSLQSALAHRGYSPVASRDEAAVLIAFDYRVQEVGSESWYRSVSQDVIRRPTPMSSTGRYVEPPPPTRDVRLVSQSERRYLIALHIEATDAKTGRAVWRVETSAIIGAADRNAILPCLVAAAEPVLDPPADSASDVEIVQGSARVRALRNGS